MATPANSLIRGYKYMTETKLGASTGIVAGAMETQGRLKQHIRQNMPDMQGFQIANVYMLGGQILSHSTGRMLGNLIASCWAAAMAPILILELTSFSEAAAAGLAETTSAYARRHGADKIGLYIANAQSQETKQRLIQAVDGEYRVWFITSEANKNDPD